jgi:hypothetical protein
VVEPPRAAVLRLSRLPSLFARTWLDAHRIVTQWDGAYSHADLGRGVVRLVLPLSGETKESDVAAVLDVPFDGSRIYERLPGPLWQRLVSPANRGRIEQGIKAAFDPQRVLNPGIFGELQ